MADTAPPPVSLGDVLKKEHEEIMEVRKKRLAKFNPGGARPLADAPAPPVPKGAPAAGKLPDLRKDDPDWANVIKEAHEANFVGLAFSGGGIRSATFNLGVLQALADLKLLCRIDYLSTVSGGGYIGSWLAAWTQRLGSFAKLQEQISTHRVHLKEDKEQPPVRFLRVFSNYLTPKLGFFSGDTWAMIAIYLRNMLLNQAIAFTLLATFLLAPRVANQWAIAALKSHPISDGLLVSGVGLLLVAFLMILANMEYLSVRQAKSAPRLTEQKWTLLLVSAPLFAAAVAAALWLADHPSFPHGIALHQFASHEFLAYGIALPQFASHEFFAYENAVLLGAIVYSALWGLALSGESLFGMLMKKKKPSPLPCYRGERLIKAGAVLSAGALAGWLLALLSSGLRCMDEAKALTFGVPLVVGVFLLAGILNIGLMGVVFHDWKREWWGRLGGWLLVFAITWLALFWLALLFPSFIKNDVLVSPLWKTLATKYLTPAWILSTIGTVMAGNSKASGKPGAVNWMDAAIKVGPYIFVAGLLCWTSWGIDCFLNIHKHLYWTLLACGVVAFVMAWRVDINQFSMHMFYRNRLVSCFLGASNSARSPNRFTGFDPGDDLPLKDFRWNAPVPYDGPYPVLNASLNLVKGKDLAWQERKAESFVMTPHFCGYDVWLEEQDSPMLMHDRPQTDGIKKPENTPPETVSVLAQQADSTTETGIVPKRQASDSAKTARAASETQNKPRKTWREKVNDITSGWPHKLERFGYRATDDYAFPTPLFNGPNLGLAMAISGAAASPNMGFYSSTPVAFLMTVFNVRLGQWLGNPRHRNTSRRATPRLGLWWLINELLGGTNDQAAYVYLSDGGHFENMGLYELVKRRCGLIIVCDAEADENYTFSGLGNAIRKCRIDLGIDIELNTGKIAPKKAAGPSGQHCVIGQIHYENADQDAPTGTIIYFKASLTGDEPTDVKNFKKGHASFPHESTVDQWFSESQFESYRELGYHEVFASIRGIPSDRGMPSAPPRPLEKDLHGILEEFGFEVEDLRQAAGSVQKAASGTDQPASASAASPSPG